MKQLLQILDSLLGSHTHSLTPDPTLYQIDTTNKSYTGYIIVQDDMMIKFRTAELKPVKILKKNIVKVTVVRELGSLKLATA